MGRGDNTVVVFPLGPQRVHAAKPDGQENGVKTICQALDRQFVTQSAAVLDRDPANAEQPVQFGLREAVDGLVSRDPVLVEATGLGSGFVERYTVPVHGQPVRRCKARWTRTDDGDVLPGFRGTRVGVLGPGHQRVGGKALQRTDFHRLLLGLLPHAGLLAQGFSGTHPGAHPTKDVAVENGLGRRFGGPGRDLADEQWDIDFCGTGCDARRVVAEIAAIGRNTGFVKVQSGVHVTEIVAQSLGIEASCNNAVLINRWQSSHGLINAVSCLSLDARLSCREQSGKTLCFSETFRAISQALARKSASKLDMRGISAQFDSATARDRPRTKWRACMAENTPPDQGRRAAGRTAGNRGALSVVWRELDQGRQGCKRSSTISRKCEICRC